MKLAEALAERAEVQARLDELKRRAVASARVQEGDVPEEDPTALMAEAERLMNRLAELVRRINATNSVTPFEGIGTITDAIAERDLAARRRSFNAEVADAASSRMDRYTRTEVKFVSTVDVARVRANADAASKRYRELDTALQQLNWSTDLV